MKKYKSKWESEICHEFTEADIRCLADEMLEWISAKTAEEGESSNFWLNDFAAVKMVTPSKLKLFALTNEYFKAVFEICKAIQESKLLKMALFKEVNPTSAVYIMKSIAVSDETDIPADMDTAKKQIEEIFE